MVPISIFDMGCASRSFRDGVPNFRLGDPWSPNVTPEVSYSVNGVNGHARLGLSEGGHSIAGSLKPTTPENIVSLLPSVLLRLLRVRRTSNNANENKRVIFSLPV